MQLKLSEYNLKDGKFEKFLELGKDFGYFGDSISVLHTREVHWEVHSEEINGIFRAVINGFIAIKDEKDPLNRFGGLFNNRSYGNGRFILIQDKQDIVDIVETKKSKIKGYYLEGMQRFKYEEIFTMDHELGTNYLGSKNLHENPELWEKIK